MADRGPTNPDHDGHDHEAHAIIERFERGWMIFALAMLVLFTVLVFHAILTHGQQIAQTGGRLPPGEILAQGRFITPGIRQTAPNRFEVNSVVQSFSFLPTEIRLPVGAETTFFITSRDVIHGYQVQGTTINFEIIPGEVASFTYTFRRPGQYRIICNQYCGIGHHNMLGMITVETREAWAAREEERLEEIRERLTRPPQEPDEPTDLAIGEFDWPELGAQTYAANCASCHQANGQGVPGVFPPLAGHAPEFIEHDHYPEFLDDDVGRQYLVAVILYGLQGPITVHGQTYNGIMPAFPHLSDEQVAAVLNHILYAWGNDAALPEAFAPYVPGEITVQRGQELTGTDVLELRRNLGFE